MGLLVLSYADLIAECWEPVIHEDLSPGPAPPHAEPSGRETGINAQTVQSIAEEFIQ